MSVFKSPEWLNEEIALEVLADELDIKYYSGLNSRNLVKRVMCNELKEFLVKTCPRVLSIPVNPLLNADSLMITFYPVFSLQVS